MINEPINIVLKLAENQTKLAQAIVKMQEDLISVVTKLNEGFLALNERIKALEKNRYGVDIDTGHDIRSRRSDA